MVLPSSLVMVTVVMVFPTVALPAVTAISTVKVSSPSSAVSSVMETLMQRVSPPVELSGKLMFIDELV